MDKDKARQLLGVSAEVARVDVERAWSDRTEQLKRRLASAPSNALREKYRAQIGTLEEALRVLVPQAQENVDVMDLPVAQASYDMEEHSGFGPVVLLTPGTVLGNDYEIRQFVGTGTLGPIYRAYDRRSARDVQLHLAGPQIAARTASRRLFVERAKQAMAAAHRHMCRILAVEQDGVHPFYVTEVLQGRTLRERFEEAAEFRQRFTVDEACGIVRDIADALEAAHPRFVHGDIRPENIWLSNGSALLTGFGMWGMGDDGDVGKMAPNMAYAAPEALRPGCRVETAADQYSLAAVAFELLSGRVSAGRLDDIRKVRPDVPRGVATALDRALSATPEKRFASPGDFAKGLFPPPPSLRSVVASPVAALDGHGRKIAIGAAAVLALLLVVLSYPMWRDATPWARGAQRQEAIRLSGVVKVLADRVAENGRAIEEQAKSDRQVADRINERMASARTPDDRMQQLRRYVQAAVAASRSSFVAGAFKAEMNGRYGSLASDLADAEGKLKAGDVAGAREGFVLLNKGYGEAKDMPPKLLSAYDARAGRTVAGLAGRWTVGGCESPSLWSVDGSRLTAAWPGQELFEEQIIGVVDDRVITQVTSPAAYVGRIYAYQGNGRELVVENMTAGGERTVLARCN